MKDVGARDWVKKEQKLGGKVKMVEVFCISDKEVRTL